MWNREGQRVSGMYLKTYPVKGTVTESRVKYGGRVQHTLVLDCALTVYGRVADIVLLDEQEVNDLVVDRVFV